MPKLKEHIEHTLEATGRALECQTCEGVRLVNLYNHAGHAVAAREGYRPDITSLECDSCGDYILEQYASGFNLWA